MFAAACGSTPTAATATDLPTEQTPELSAGTVVASAEVVPVRESHLSFVISGTVKDLAVSEGEVVSAGETLLTLSAPELEYAVLQAEAALRAAEFEYQYWVPARFDRPPERRQLAEQELVKVQKALDTAEAELGQASITAPFDGTVTSITIAAGELVQPGQVVITLADLDELQIETIEVQVGQPAGVLIEALNESFAGRIVQISPMAEIVGGDVVYRVTLTLDSPPAQLSWGMSAEVQIAPE
jgi:HlyD family secretion protein